jgi:hypothetical protein
MSFKPKVLSSDEVDALLNPKLSDIKVSFAVSNQHFSVNFDEGFLAVNETFAEAFMRNFSMARLSEMKLQLFFGSLLGNLDRFNVQLSPELVAKLKDLENSFPCDNRKAIDDFVMVIRSLVSEGFALTAVASDRREEVLLSYDNNASQFSGSVDIVAFLRPLLEVE